MPAVAGDGPVISQNEIKSFAHPMGSEGCSDRCCREEELRLPSAMDHDLAPAQLDDVPWNPYDSLDKRLTRCMGGLEHDDIATPDRLGRGDPGLDQDAFLIQEGRKHGTSFHLVRLEEKKEGEEAGQESEPQITAEAAEGWR